MYIQKIYGKKENTLADLVDRGYLPAQFKNYIQTKKAVFDIETLEVKNQRQNEDLIVGTFEEAVLRPVSIGCSNNITNEDRFFVRQSSDPDDAPRLVHSFLDYLFELMDKYLQTLPIELSHAAEKLATELKTEKFSKAKAEKQSFANLLQNYRTFVCYGFNSGKSYPHEQSFRLTIKQLCRKI